MSRSSNTLPSRMVGDTLCEACPIDLVDTSMYLRLYRAGLLGTNFGKLVTEKGPRFLRFLQQYQHIPLATFLQPLCLVGIRKHKKNPILEFVLCESWKRYKKRGISRTYYCKIGHNSKKVLRYQKKSNFEIESDTTFRTV